MRRVDLLVDIEQCFRQRSEFTLRAKPDEALFAKVEQDVSAALAGAPKSPMAPTLIGEVQHQWKLAGELMPFPPSRIAADDYSPKVYWAYPYREHGAKARLERRHACLQNHARAGSNQPVGQIVPRRMPGIRSHWPNG